jgi:hypothetical protein
MRGRGSRDHAGHATWQQRWHPELMRPAGLDGTSGRPADLPTGTWRRSTPECSANQSNESTENEGPSRAIPWNVDLQALAPEVIASLAAATSIGCHGGGSMASPLLPRGQRPEAPAHPLVVRFLPLPPRRTSDGALVGEIIDGELVASPRPAPRHALASSAVGTDLFGAFGRGRTGDWWILLEPELHLGPDVLDRDVVGWRRQWMPTLPETAFFTVRPRGTENATGPCAAPGARRRAARPRSPAARAWVPRDRSRWG